MRTRLRAGTDGGMAPVNQGGDLRGQDGSGNRLSRRSWRSTTNARRASRWSRVFTGVLLALGVAVLAAGIAFRVADFHVQTGATGYQLVFVVPHLGWLTELRSVGLIVAGFCVALLILLEIRKGVGPRRAPAVS
jgi:hypothetical protein